jgi:superfamily II DNA or RNA helicase
MQSLTLRPYQAEMLRKLEQRPDKRLLLLWATSAGKTLGALAAARQLSAKRILVVCPAIARGTWLAEFAKWAPEYVPFSVRIGRERSSGVSKKQAAYRDAAYAADVQIVSYGLLKQLDPQPYDLIVLDEFHALRDPLSQQSKAVRKVFRANEHTPALALSATGIPTDPKQLWNPLDLFWPGQWGYPQPTGGVSWRFQAQYCAKVENEYGAAYKGAKSPEALETLARRLDPFVHRVSDTEVAAFLPPLHAERLQLDQRCEVGTVSRDWLESLPESAIPIVVCFLRETAATLATLLDGRLITGAVHPEQRLAILAEAAANRQLVVATSESIRESISLSAFTHALIFEWRTSPAQAIQLLGRFARQDTVDLTRPTYVQYVVQPGDDARADLLQERVDAVNVVLQKDSKAERLVELFKPQELTEDRIETLFSQMLGNMRTVDVNSELEEVEL